jgi:hypothetical protein
MLFCLGHTIVLFSLKKKSIAMSCDFLGKIRRVVILETNLGKNIGEG